MPSPPKQQLRLRVFAGPNGSGKSTVIDYVKNYKVSGRNIDFGYYINADDIAKELRKSGFKLGKFNITSSRNEFIEIAEASGLIRPEYTFEAFTTAFTYFKDHVIKLKKGASDERLAQVIADFLRKKLLKEKKRFSFETVFSHPSKLDIMRQAKEQGYKVYLYFVSTENPEINKFRVKSRATQGGHDVPPDLIESRYYRSLDLLYEACQLAYQVYFFDNSKDNEEGESEMFAHFELVNGAKKWDPIDADEVPVWFLQYYSAKIRKA